jgi:hypothetical protein
MQPWIVSIQLLAPSPGDPAYIVSFSGRFGKLGRQYNAFDGWLIVIARCRIRSSLRNPHRGLAALLRFVDSRRVRPKGRVGGEELGATAAVACIIAMVAAPRTSPFPNLSVTDELRAYQKVAGNTRSLTTTGRDQRRADYATIAKSLVSKLSKINRTRFL